MTEIIDKAFVRQCDDKLLAQGLKLHQRPFHVALAWMKAKGIAGNIFDKAAWEPFMRVYRELYPTGDFSGPAMFMGGVALRDQMYPVRISFIFGTFALNPIDCIEIPPKELEFIFKYYPEQVWRAVYGVADLWDFAYGISDLSHGTGNGPQLFSNARSSIAATARILAGDNDIDAAVQTICLTAELALKGALASRGWPEPQYRKLSHRLDELAEALISEVSTSRDDRLRGAIKQFPDYVRTRYEPHGLPRTELMVLAMRAQFVAAEAVRRVSDRDIASELEANPNSLPRPMLW